MTKRPPHSSASWSRSPVVCLLLTAAGLLTSGDSVSAQSSDEPIRVRENFVPIDQLDAVLARDGRGVMLPREEFRKLLEQAERNRRAKPNVPAPIVVTGASLSAQPEQRLLSMTARIRFRQFESGWQGLGLRLRGLAVESAEVDGQPARMGRNSRTQDAVYFLHNTAGEHTLDLTLSTPLSAAGSDRVAAFGLPELPSATLSLAVPAGKRLIVNDLQPGRPVPIDQDAEYKIEIGGMNEVRLRLTDREQSLEADSMVFASTAYGLRVTPGEISWQAVTSLQIFGRPTNQFRVHVPNTLEIADVESSGLESWELNDAPGGQPATEITLNYRQAVAQNRRVIFRGVMSASAEETWSVPGVRIAGVTSHVGRAIIRHPIGTRLRLENQSGVRRTEIAEAEPEAAGGDANISFDIWQEDFSLQFSTQPKQREVFANLSTILDVTRKGIDLETLARIECLYAPMFEARLSLPSDWSVVAAQINNQPADWQIEPRAAGTHRIRVTFPGPLQPGQKLDLKLFARYEVESDGAGDQYEFPLPEVRVLEAGVVDGAYLIKSDAEFEVEPITISGLDPAKLALNEPHLGYRYQDGRFSGQMRAQLRSSEIAATTVSYSRLDRDALRTWLEVRVDVTGGGIRDLRIQLPEATGEGVRFQVAQAGGDGVRVVEQTSDAPADGRRAWTLRFDRRYRGHLVLQTSLESARDDADSFQVHTALVDAAERQSGYVAIEGDSEQQLTFDPGDDFLAPVDPVDLPASRYTPQQRIVAAWRYVMPAFQIGLSETRYDRVGVPTAVCREIKLTSVLSEAGDFQHQAVARFVAVGTQAIQVRFPTDTRLWSTSIDGQAVEVRRTDDAYIVPLPPAASADAERMLKLIYETRVPEIELVGRIRHDPPLLSVNAGRGVEQPLEVLEQSWNVTYPESMMLVASDGRFEPRGRLDQDSVLALLGDGISQPDWRRIRQHGTAVLAVAGIAWLITMCFRFWRWKGVVLVGCIGFLFMCLSMPAVQQARRSVYPVADSAAPTPATLGDQASAGGAMVANDAEFDMDGAMPIEAMPMEAMAGEQMDQLMELEAEVAQPAAIPQAEAPTQPRGEDRPQAFSGMQAPVPADQSGMMGRGQQSATTSEGIDPASGPVAGRVATDRFGRVNLSMRGRDVRGARLSVNVDFQVPPDQPTLQFGYVGALQAGARPALDVVAQNRRAGDFLRFVAALVTVLLLWCMRNRPLSQRGAMAVALVLLPLAIVPIISSLPLRGPVGMVHGILDGIVLGAIVGVCLWVLKRIVDSLRALVREAHSIPRSMAAMIAVAFVTAASATQAQQKAEPAQSAESQAAPTPPTQRPGSDDLNVVVPYDPDGLPLAAPRVFIPHSRFLELWHNAWPDKQPVQDPSIESVVTGGVYEASVGDDERIDVQAKLIVHSFRDHQVSTPLPLGASIAVSQAELDGETATLVPLPKGSKGNGGGLAVLIDQRGTHVLDLTFSIAARRIGPAGRFTLPLQPTAASLLRFTLPEAALRISVAGPGSAYRRTVDGDRERIEVPVGRGGNIVVSWQPETQRAGVNTVVHVNGSSRMIFDETGMKLQAGFEILVRQGSIDQATFALPDDLRVQRIAGPDLAGWEFMGDAGQRQLKVFLRRSVRNRTALYFDLYRSLSVTETPTDIEFPAFHPVGVTRETGQLAVVTEPQFEVRSGAVSGVTQINPNQYRVISDSKEQTAIPALAWRYVSRPASVTIAVSRPKAQAIASAEHGVRVDPRRVRSTSRFRVQLKEAPRSRIAFELPDGFVPLDVNATGINDWYQFDDQGRPALLVELDGPRRGLIEVAIEGAVTHDPDISSLEIGLLRPLGVDQLSSRVAIWLHPVYTATMEEPAGWRSIAPQSLSQDHLKLNPAPPQFALESKQVEPGSVNLGLLRASPLITAESVTVITATDASVEYAVNLQWHVRNAAADKFHVTAPGYLGGQLDFRVPGLRRLIEAQQPDGRVQWTISLQEPVSGRFYALAAATLPPPDDARVLAPSVEFVTEQAGQEATSLATQSHYSVLVNQSTGQLTNNNPDNTIAADREELPIVVPAPLLDQAAEIIRIRETAPTWTLTRFQEQSSAPASVNLADLTTVIASDGTWRTQALYTIRNRSRQFLPVVLPGGSKLLSVFVRNVPARPVITNRGEESIHLIALPKTSASDLSFQVKLVLAGTFGDALPAAGPRPLGETLSLPTPRIVSIKQDADFGIPVVRTRWVVHAPDAWDVSPIRDDATTNMTLVDSDSDEELYVETVAREATEMFNVLSIASSSKQKMQAKDNLKQIGLALQRYNTSGNAKVQQELREFQGKLDALGDKVEAEIVQTPADLDFSEGFVEFRNDATEEQRRGYFSAQNRFLYDSNSGMGLGSDGSRRAGDGDLELFRFDIETPSFDDQGQQQARTRARSGKDPKAAEKAAKPTGNAVLEQKRRSKSSSLSQLESLNSARGVDDLRAGQQQMDSMQLAEPERRLQRGFEANTPAFGSRQLTLPQQQLGGMPAPAGADDFGGVAGGAGGGGGFAGGGFGGGMGGAVFDTGAVATGGFVPQWTGVGGLSLDISVPTDGQALTFTRIAGDPKLTVRIRPKEASNLISRIAWSVVLTVVTLLLIVAVLRSDAERLMTTLPKLLVVAALAILVLLPESFFGLGMLLFVVGTIGVGIQVCRQPVAGRG